MIQERQRAPLNRSVHILPGDMLVCEVQDRKTKQTFVHKELIGREMVVDTIVTFDVKDEFGLEDGIGAIFGKTKG